jgi:hypothetical protein
MRSSVATAWASNSGLRSAAIKTAVPTVMRLVRAATAASIVSGSKRGRLNRESPIQTESKPELLCALGDLDQKRRVRVTGHDRLARRENDADASHAADDYPARYCRASVADGVTGGSRRHVARGRDCAAIVASPGMNSGCFPMIDAFASPQAGQCQTGASRRRRSMYRFCRQ